MRHVPHIFLAGLRRPFYIAARGIEPAG